MLSATQQLSRTQSELAKARSEAESISFALRQAHRSAANLGALAQRVTATEKAALERRKSAVGTAQRARKHDPSNDFGITVDLKSSGKRSMTGEQKRSLLIFDTKAEFKNDVESSSSDSDDDDAMKKKKGAKVAAAAQNSDATQEVTEDSFDYRDLVFYLFDGFPRADLAGMFPTWYEASLWAEKLNFFFVILSIVAIATETLPEYYNEDLQVFSVIENISIAYFSLDFAARIFCAPNLPRFLKSMLNWVDIVSILPFYIQLAVGDGVSMLRYFRLLRILRVLKLSRRNVGLMAVWEALRESSEAITLLGFLMMIALLLFSSLMFYAEQVGGSFDAATQTWMRSDGKVSPFQSIFHAMWWCIVTMSTVGYGDEVPITVLGKLVGGATMICGVFVLAFPTVILSTNFQEIHQSKVDGHLQMQQIYTAQREAARHRAEERKKRRIEEHQQLLAEELQHLVDVGSDGGEVERNDVEEMALVPPTNGSNPIGAHISVTNSRTADDGPDVHAASIHRMPSFARPTTFPFAFDPYADVTSNRPAISIHTTELFETDETNSSGKSSAMHREVVLIGDQVALYNPALHFVCRGGCLRVKVVQCLSRTVVTINLALESMECQRAAEEAVAFHRPDLYGKAMILPRPISKLKVDVVCDHPLLHEVRLQCSTFTEPAGVVPLSLVVPYPSLVSVLLANMSSLSVMTWISYEGPSAVDEPLYHYGGAVLAGTDFEEEELDHHARKLIADPLASTMPMMFASTADSYDSRDASLPPPQLATDFAGAGGRQSPAFGDFTQSTRRIFGDGALSASVAIGDNPPLAATSTNEGAFNRNSVSINDFDRAAASARRNTTRRLSLDVSGFASGAARSPVARSPLSSPFPAGLGM
jgi:hypothetical protein